MKSLRNFYLLVLVAILAGCDPIWYDEYVIHNETNKDLTLYYQRYLISDTSIVINPKSSLIFFQGGGSTGYAKDYGVQFLTLHFDSIQISMTDATSIAKDLHDRTNWTFTIIEDGNETAIYEFTLTNQDLK